MKLTTPDGYVTWPAEQKQAWLWNSLIGSTAYGATDLPALVLPFKTAPIDELSIVLKKDELNKALTRESDLMEVGRPKVIHAKGAVAMVELVTSADSPFSGMLAPPSNGGAAGMLRLSLVAKVDRNAAFTPALALKLLIDGRPSADVLAMNHTVGQGRDFNLFSNTMTNDLSDTHNELRPAQRIMSRLFSRISHQPRRMISDHLAIEHRDGSPVHAKVAPDRLVFRPTVEAVSLFEDRAGVDFRLVLAEASEGIVLYEIDGIAGSETHPVGHLRTSSRFVASSGGDRLYFRHVHDPADHKL